MKHGSGPNQQKPKSNSSAAKIVHKLLNRQELSPETLRKRSELSNKLQKFYQDKQSDITKSEE